MAGLRSAAIIHAASFPSVRKAHVAAPCVLRGLCQGHHALRMTFRARCTGSAAYRPRLLRSNAVASSISADSLSGSGSSAAVGLTDQIIRRALPSLFLGQRLTRRRTLQHLLVTHDYPEPEHMHTSVCGDMRDMRVSAAAPSPRGPRPPDKLWTTNLFGRWSGRRGSTSSLLAWP